MQPMALSKKDDCRFLSVSADVHVAVILLIILSRFIVVEVVRLHEGCTEVARPYQTSFPPESDCQKIKGCSMIEL